MLTGNQSSVGDNNNMTDQNLAIVVLAAGRGTRMKSERPKVLHSLAGVPIVGHVLATARELAPEHIVVVVRHDRDAVAATVLELLPEAMIVDQDEIPGTGRAVEQAIAALPTSFTGDVMIVSGDVPLLDAATLTGLLMAHRDGASAATLLSAIFDDATGYGRIVRTTDGAVDRIVEQKDASPEELEIHEVNSGQLHLPPRAAAREARPGHDPQRSGREVHHRRHRPAAFAPGSDVTAVPVSENWIVGGINDRVQLAETARRLNQLIVRGWQLAGVTILDPDSTWIDLQATIAEDVELLPGTILVGPTVIERGAIIGPDTSLDACEIGEGAVVRRTDATLAVIGAERNRRSVRLPAPGNLPRRERQDRHLRRNQELAGSATAARCRTSATSATPRSARVRTSARARSRPTTTA